ncbi:MAG: hypothetical protein HUJ53_09235 [Holdemanella sp.]|nr:hypothetical protein [Holdemanella sp.]
MIKGKKAFKTPQDMLDAWNRYKEHCNTRTVVQTVFSQKDGKFVSSEVPHPITCTLKGFSSYMGMDESTLFKTYTENKNFKSVIACMKQDCENDAREKFENGTLDSRLAGLWMSNHGYTTNVEQKVEADMSLDIKIDYGDDE